jgi:hypothetical protein
VVVSHGVFTVKDLRRFVPGYGGDYRSGFSPLSLFVERRRCGLKSKTAKNSTPKKSLQNSVTFSGSFFAVKQTKTGRS